MNCRSNLTLLAIALLAVAGCRQEKQIGDFRPENEPRAVHYFVSAQTSNGARADGMLQAHHFDAQELNSLGRQKLTAMSDTGGSAVLVVYLNLPEEDDQTEARQESVRQFLQDRGRSEAHARVEIGTNPGAVSPAAKQFDALNRRGLVADESAQQGGMLRRGTAAASE